MNFLKKIFNKKETKNIELDRDIKFLKKIKEFISKGKKEITKTDPPDSIKWIHYSITSNKKIRDITPKNTFKKKYINPHETFSFNDNIDKIKKLHEISKKKQIKNLNNIPEKCVFCKEKINQNKIKIKNFKYFSYAGSLAMSESRGICIFCDKCGEPIAYHLKLGLLS